MEKKYTIEQIINAIFRADSDEIVSAIVWKNKKMLCHLLRKDLKTMSEESIRSTPMETSDIEQAIAYFKDELSTMNVFSDTVSFQENERKSIETALNVLQKVYEENQNRQQDGSR